MIADRRTFLVRAAVAGGMAAAGPSFWQRAYAEPVVVGDGPYGPLSAAPDGNGLRLPAGFTSRIVARAGQIVPGTAYVWPLFPDGAATFPTDDGGWVHVVNSEVLGGAGGASALRFDRDGEVVDGYRILAGTSGNCAGGPTPWGTWLSCEEAQAQSNVGEGRVWECDPFTPGQGIVRPALGSFNHEAVAVDPEGRRLYLTEDRSDGRFYRFTPDRYPDLASGRLEVAVVDETGSVTWREVPDPSAASKTTRSQVADSTQFAGGEGCWYDEGFVYFTTKGDNRVWAHDLAAGTIVVIYDAADHGDAAPLTGVDNLVVSASNDLYVAEDGGDMQIQVITPDRRIGPIVQVVGADSSEITGPVFDPSGSRLYFSSQRGGDPLGGGITYEITGPFRSAPAATGGGAVPGTTGARPVTGGHDRPGTTGSGTPSHRRALDTGATSSGDGAGSARDGALGASSVLGELLPTEAGPRIRTGSPAASPGADGGGSDLRVGLGLGAAGAVGAVAWFVRRRSTLAADPSTSAMAADGSAGSE